MKKLTLVKNFNKDTLPVITMVEKTDNTKLDYFPYLVWNNNENTNVYSIYTAVETPKYNLLVELEKSESEKDVYSFTKLLDSEIAEESEVMNVMYEEFFSDISEIINAESKLVGISADVDSFMIQ